MVWAVGILGWWWGTQGEHGGELCCGQRRACLAAAGTDPLGMLYSQLPSPVLLLELSGEIPTAGTPLEAHRPPHPRAASESLSSVLMPLTGSLRWERSRSACLPDGRWEPPLLPAPFGCVGRCCLACCYQHRLWKLSFPACYFWREHVIKSVPRASLRVEGGSQLCSQQRKGVHAAALFRSPPRPFFLLERLLPCSAPASDADGAPVSVSVGALG